MNEARRRAQVAAQKRKWREARQREAEHQVELVRRAERQAQIEVEWEREKRAMAETQRRLEQLQQATQRHRAQVDLKRELFGRIGKPVMTTRRTRS